MTIHQFKKLASRTIIGNGVRRRPQAIEPVPALLVRLELTAQVEFNLLGILLLIQSVCRSLPHLDCCAHKRLLGLEVHDATVHERHLGIRGSRLDDVLAVLAVRGISAEEWTQDCGGGRGIIGFFGESECDFVNEAGSAPLAGLT